MYCKMFKQYRRLEQDRIAKICLKVNITYIITIMYLITNAFHSFVYECLCSRYPLTPGWGSYDYFYGRSARDQPPAGRNVDPFPGKFLGFGSVQYEKGRRDVQLQCHLSKDGNKPVSVSTNQRVLIGAP